MGPPPAIDRRASCSSSTRFTTLRTYSVRLATGAGLEPAPPACAGALTVELPCSRLPFPFSSPAGGSGNLDLSDGTGHLGASPLSDGTGHTEPPFEAFRMSDGTGRGVRRDRTGFCFFRPGFRGVYSKSDPSHFS